MLKAIFGSKALLGAASAGVLAVGGGAVALSGNAAEPAQPAKIEQASVQTTPAGTPVAKTRKDAYLASADHIILHEGEGLRGVGQIAEILNERGCPTTVYAGGAAGTVEMFVGKGKFGPYTQDDIDAGTLGASAIGYYQERVGPCGKRTAELTND